jgi:hypothetical protein
MNPEQKLLAREIRKKLTGSVPEAILDRLSDDDLVHQYELKNVADMKRFNDARLAGKGIDRRTLRSITDKEPASAFQVGTAQGSPRV